MQHLLHTQVPVIPLCHLLYDKGFQPNTIFYWDMKRLNIEIGSPAQPVILLHKIGDPGGRCELATCCGSAGEYMTPVAQLLPAPSVQDMLQALPSHYVFQNDIFPIRLKKSTYENGRKTIYDIGPESGDFLPDVLARVILFLLDNHYFFTQNNPLQHGKKF